MADIKEKVICPWCKEEMRPYYWFECKCGARSPSLWNVTQERAREKALSYTTDVVPKSEVMEMLDEIYAAAWHDIEHYGIRVKVVQLKKKYTEAKSDE